MKKITTWSLVFCLLCVWGCDDSDDATPLGDWVKVTPLEGDARSAAVSFVIGNKAYVGTGYDGEDRLTDCWEFDPGNRSWRQIASFGGVARNNAVAFTINGKGYVGTGYSDDFLKDFWEYDPALNRWARKADFGGTARQSATAFSISNRGYVGTGYIDGGKYISDFWSFDPNDASNGYDSLGLPLGKWTQVASLTGKNPKRRGASSFVIDNQAYVGFGESSGLYLEDILMYDAETNQWTEKQELEDEGRAFAASFVLNGKAYVGAGYNGGNRTDLWEYNSTTDQWTERTGFEGAARMYPVSFAIGDKAYLGTGSSGSYFDDLWEFSPDISYDEEN